MKKRNLVYIVIAFLLFLEQSGYSQPPATGVPYKYPYPDGISFETYATRRNQVNSQMSNHSLLVAFSGDYYTAFNEEFPIIRQNPNLYYLTGSPDMRNILLLIPGGYGSGGQKVTEILFLNDIDAHSQFWSGSRFNFSSAPMLGIHRIMPLSEFVNILDNLLESRDSLYMEIPHLSSGEDTTGSIISGSLLKFGRPIYLISDIISKHHTQVVSFNNILKKMREVKDNEELRLMKKAAEISINSFRQTIKDIKPPIPEYAIQADIEYWFKKQGAETLAFPSIIGSGFNSTIIHYMNNRDTARSGDVIVMDCGAEYHGYSSDITRTVPAKGKFTDEQRLIYNSVLEAHDSAIALCRKGKSFMQPHMKAMEIITKKLKELGIIQEDKDYRYYFTHGTSHYMGIDVHDVGTYGNLKPGNVITIEPGIYIPEGSPCDMKWWNIGVRIEDDVLITEGEPEVLTSKLPVKPDEIEELMK